MLSLGEADMRRVVAAEARDALTALPAVPDPGVPNPAPAGSRP